MATRVDINLSLANQIAMDAAERGVRAVVIDAEGITKTLLSQPGSGRLYQRGKTVEHRASAPGEPPAPDTGRLRASVTTEVVRGPNEVTGYVAVNTEYAAALELGTEKVKPRPYLSRIPREFGARLRAIFEQFAKV
jgi:hypothetical protein